MNDTAPPPAAELAQIREGHQPDSDNIAHRPTCAACGQWWPCDAARLLSALDDERLQRMLYEDDIRGYVADIDRLAARLDAAQCRLPKQDGGTLVVTAAELWAAHQEARQLVALAQVWAAAWKRAAKHARADQRAAYAATEHLAAHGARIADELLTLRDRLAAAERVVVAARAVQPIIVQWMQGGWLGDTLAAYDAAREGD